MFFLSRTRATIKDTLFLNGDAATAGGGFHVDRGASAEVHNTSFINNTVSACVCTGGDSAQHNRKQCSPHQTPACCALPFCHVQQCAGEPGGVRALLLVVAG